MTTKIHGETSVAEQMAAKHLDGIRPASGAPTATTRRAAYIATGLGSVVVFLILRGLSWESSSELHTLMEGLSAVLALLAGAMALVHFYSRPDNSFLFLGWGLIGAGLLDGYHTVVTSAFFAPLLPSSLPAIVPWSWVASRLFLSCVIGASLFAWLRERRLGKEGRIDSRYVLLSVLVIAASICLFLALVPLPPAYYLGQFLHRPQEFGPAVLFTAALAGYLYKGGWRTSPFEHWLVISLIVAIACHALFMAASHRIFDTPFDVAHVFKIFSYVCVLIGLLRSMFVVFREADTAYRNLQRGIEERKRAEVELRAREEELAKKSSLLETTLESMSHGIAVYDPQGRLIAFNRKSVELRDYPPGFLKLGMTVEDMYRHKAREGYYGSGDPEEYVAERMADYHRRKADRRERVRSDGTVVAIHRAPMPDGGQVTTYTDITREKQIEADLRRTKEQAEYANRSKTEFLANMSHELRTPLNAIIGFSEVLRSQSLGPLGNSTYLEYAEDINSSGQHLLGLINDILDLSKIESRKIDLNEEVFGLEGVVRSCVSMMKSQAASQGVKINVDVAEDVSPMRADQRMVKQILLNLLSNAVKFTPEGGAATLKAWSQPGGGNVFQVIDTGIGVALNDIPKILQPFAQADNHLTRAHHGTGLGLPLSKKLVELHGGYLDFQSELGKGSTVTVRFPKERMVARRAVHEHGDAALQGP